MKKVLFFTFIITLLASMNLAFADDLNITFDDDSDIANWSHHDETNVWTTEAWDATGGVGGGGALKLTDGGYTIIAKRAITGVMGKYYSLTIDINVDTWGGGDLELSVQGLSSTDPMVIVSGFTGYQTFTLTGKADLAEAGYIRLYSLGSTTAPVVFVDNVAFADDVPGPDLFFSEYIEGDYGNNKGLEIYNPTDAAIDLADYRIAQAGNGGGWQYYHEFPAGAAVAAGDVWVVVTDAVDPVLFDSDHADETLAYPSPVHHNGDDARAMIKIVGTDTTWLDIIGDPDNDPGSGWDVAGVAAATANHTLVRKETVTMGQTDWATSAGTDVDNSEWIVYDANTWDYMDAHPGMPVYEPEFVNVTIRANTSTNLDTLGVNHFVQLRGALNEVSPNTFPDGKQITWGSDSDLELTNVDGDYWDITFQMAPDDTLYYKLWTGIDNATGTSPGGGWEGPFEVSNGLTWDTRTFISGLTDTVLDVQYYHPDLSGAKTEQYWRPFESKQDTVAIYFRVNMAGMTESKFFDPAVNGPVGIRGGAPVGDNDWSEGAFVPLTRENDSVLEGSFWSGTAYVPVDSIVLGNTQSYKFFVQNDGGKSWEDTPNREFVLSADLVATGDTTVHWDWFSGIKYVGLEPVESIITWRVSTEALESLGLFDRGLNDSIIVRGPKGWGKDDAVRLDYQPLLKEWVSANEQFNTIPGNEIEYKYYIAWDSSRVDETSPNYINFIDLEDDGYEEPSIRGGANRLHVYEDVPTQYVEGDFGFDRQFFNSVPANGVFEHNMSITWNVNMTPATSHSTPFTAGDSLWVQWDGELLGITQGWDNRGEDGRFLLLTDDNADMVYSATFDVDTRGWYQLGYVLTYKTADGTVVQNGTGTSLGRRYYQYIHPNSIAEGTPWPIPDWPMTFDLPVVDWSFENLFVESPPPDLTTPYTDISDKDNKLPYKYALEQNYPNPFNPVTTIKYELASASKVEISVYNIMGQLVTTLVNKELNAGQHQMVWNGRNMSGNQVTSGIYFLKMKSDNFTKVRKMTLLK